MSRILIKDAQIVTMDDAIGDFDRADLLIDDGAITKVGPMIDAAGADIIDAGDMIALPGIIEAHNCLWQTVLRGFVPNLWFGTYFTKMLPLRLKYRPEDNFNAAYIGGFEALSYGATTVVDYCHNVRGPGYAEASISALRETGIRHVFTHSFMNAKPDHFASEQAQYDYARKIHAEFHDPNSLTTINFGVESFGAPGLEKQLAFARGLKAPSCIHVNEANVIAQLDAKGLLGPDLLIIHGNLISNDELMMMARSKTPLCFTPSADVQGTPADVVRRGMDRGIEVVFGCDVPCHVASDTLGQLRAMYYVQGFLDGAMERSFSIVSTRRPAVRKGMPLLTPRELLRIATIQTAKVFGLDDRIGSLTPGKRADVVLVRKGPFGDSIEPDACAHVLLQTSARDIDTVIVDGKVRMTKGALQGFDSGRVKAMMSDSRRQILA
jgi:5-methylthioadenosine/S-adenosylhomocysteine deaminase